MPQGKSIPPIPHDSGVREGKPYKTYKITNKKTGKSTEVAWSGSKPPSATDVRRIQAEEYERKKNSFRSEDFPSIFGTAARALTIPQTVIPQPKVLPPEEEKNLPLIFSGSDFFNRSKVGRKIQQTAHDIVSPANIVSAPAGLSKAGMVAMGGLFGGEAVSNVPATTRALLEDPSFETGSNFALNLGMGALAVGGARSGYRGMKEVPKGKGPLRTPVEEPIVEAPTKVQKQITGEIAEPGVTYGEGFTMRDPKVEAPSPIEPKLLTSKSQQLLPEQVEAPITGEGFTVRAPKVITPITERPVELMDRVNTFGKTVEPLEVKSPELELPTNNYLKQQSTEALETMRRGSHGDLLTEIDAELTSRGFVQEPRMEPPPELAPENISKLYGSSVKRLQNMMVEGTPHPREIRKAVSIGLHANKTWEQITSDLINIGIDEKTARIAANRVFRESEAGFFNFADLFSKKPAPKAFRMTNRAAKGEPTRWQEVKADATDLSKLVYNLAVPSVDALGRLVGKFPEVADLQLKLKRVPNQSRVLGGTAFDEIHTGGVEGNRVASATNLSDTEFGVRLVKDMEGNTHEVLPSTTLGANEGQFGDWYAGKFKLKEGFEEVPQIKGNLWDVIEKGETPASVEVGKAAKNIQDILDRLHTEAVNVGIEIPVGDKWLKFQHPGRNFMPHKYTREFMESIKGDIGALADSLLKKVTKSEMSYSDVENYIGQSGKSREIFSAPQDHIYSPEGYIRDRSALFDYVRELSDRIAETKELGPKGMASDYMKAVRAAVEKQGGNTSVFDSYVRSILDKEYRGNPFQPAEDAVYRATSTIVAARYLPLFFLSNLANLKLTPATAGLSNTVKAMIENAKVSTRLGSNNVRSGAMQGMIVDSLAPESKIAQLYKLRETEQFARGTASTAHRWAAEDMFRDLKVNPESPAAKLRTEKLKDLLLVNDEELAKILTQDKLTSHQLDTAGGRGAEITQGTLDNINLPYYAHNPGWILNNALMYKRFAFVDTVNIIKAIKQDPVRTIPTLMATSQVLGEVVGDAKSALKGALASLFTDESMADAVIREVERRGDYLQKNPILRNHPLAARMVNNFLDSWALGIVSDFAMAATSEELGAWASGPALNQVQDILSSLSQVINDVANETKDGWDALERQLKKYAPASLGSAVSRSQDSSE